MQIKTERNQNIESDTSQLDEVIAHRQKWQPVWDAAWFLGLLLVAIFFVILTAR